MFTAIGELILKDEFQQAQVEFMEQNAGVFEDTDENKLEYTPLHEEFIKLTENAIEAHVKEKLGLTQEDIDTFYAALQEPNKLKVLEATNKDTVDHLFTMLDFNKFKKQMIESKKDGAKSADTAAEIS